MLLRDIPGYERAIARARKKETFIRLAPFVPQDRRAAGIPILPLTLGHYILLALIQSPLLVSSDAGAVDCINYLWIVSPDYLGPGSPVTARVTELRQAKKRRPAYHPQITTLEDARQARVLWLAEYGPRLLKYLEREGGVTRLAKRLHAEVKEALYDCQKSAESDSSNRHAVHFAPSLLDEFASEYGWSRAEILREPLSALLQERRGKTLRKNPETTLSSPSDKAGIAVIRKHVARQQKKSQMSGMHPE